MTEHFEVLDRDGAARIGELRLDPPLRTPALVDGRLANSGSIWRLEQEVPEPTDDRVTMLPHRGFPPGTPEQVVEAFAEEVPSFAGPSGAVIHPQHGGDKGVDVYALSTTQGFMEHAASFCETIIEVREQIPYDAALYLSGVATPSNLPLLAYGGVDLVDTDRARIAGSQGRYLTDHGEYRLDDLVELPCSCAACEPGIGSFDEGDCEDHNVHVLRGELAAVRERIRLGRLRDYVSARCRHVPWLTAAFRRFDEDWSYVERHTPLFRQATFYATTDDDLRRVEVRRFIDRIAERYRSQFRTPLVLLPCSARKPYAESQSHRQFRGAISYRAHRVSLSSPIGVVPQELECTYPAQHYDVPVTGRWSASERETVGEALADYLRTNAYPRVIAHVGPDAYRDVVEAAADVAGVDVTYTVSDHPTTEESLERLETALEGELKYSRRDRQHHTVRALADYQFGRGAGAAMFADVDVESPYPKHRVLNDEGELLATMVPEYGLLAFTIAGGHHWLASDVPTKRVEIDDFVPHGDVLAPGVVHADAEIREGDEVVVEGPAAFAVGRACMHGRALSESSRGVAIDVRHTQER